MRGDPSDVTERQVEGCGPRYGRDGEEGVWEGVTQWGEEVGGHC